MHTQLRPSTAQSVTIEIQPSAPEDPQHTMNADSPLATTPTNDSAIHLPLITRSRETSMDSIDTAQHTSVTQQLLGNNRSSSSANGAFPMRLELLLEMLIVALLVFMLVIALAR